MEKFLELLNTNDDLELEVNVISKNEEILLIGMRFIVFDYYDENDYIKIIEKSGGELLLPKTNVNMDEENDGWTFTSGDVEVNIFV